MVQFGTPVSEPARWRSTHRPVRRPAFRLQGKLYHHPKSASDTHSGSASTTHPPGSPLNLNTEAGLETGTARGRIAGWSRVTATVFFGAGGFTGARPPSRRRKPSLRRPGASSRPPATARRPPARAIDRDSTAPDRPKTRFARPPASLDAEETRLDRPPKCFDPQVNDLDEDETLLRAVEAAFPSVDSSRLPDLYQLR